MAKIWQKDYELNSLMEEFSVGRDYLLDQNLVPSDCAASIAHGKMLNKIGILSDKEISSIKKELSNIVKDHSKGEFLITLSDEDCHTAIENRLINKLGDAGKKIHTGRSRNDQVITATRLYSRAFVLDMMKEGLNLVKAFEALAKREKMTPMPGRTHMQIAMPSSVGLWAASFAEELLDQIKLFNYLYSLINQNPLGSAASYGVPLALDREMTADLMGFDSVQNNVLYVNNSRGRFESMLIDASDQLVITLSKAAQDLILFSLPEFGYFSLPDVLCSGSSIMPQKKNPDGLELMRAKSGTLSSYASAIKNIVRSLPTGYNRDLQETKEPFIQGTRLAIQCVKIMNLTISKLKVNKEALEKGFTSDIYATDMAIELVASGMSFRDAYKKVGLELDKVDLRDAVDSLKSRTSSGTTGNLNLNHISNSIEQLKNELEVKNSLFSSKMKELVGFPFSLF